MEDTIRAIIEEFGATLWLGFVTFVITAFVMSIMKNFVLDLVLYFRVRTSDLGKGAMIKWSGQLKMVKSINFKEIEIFDDEEVLYIPIKSWLNSVKVYPKPRDDQFDEKQWRRWDRITDRRQEDKLNGSKK